MEKSVKSQVTLKSLQTRLEREKAELSVVSRQMNELKHKQREHNGRIESIQKQLKELTKDELILSEHAKLRFLERVQFIPLDEIEAKIITPELKRMWNVLGNAEFPIGIGEHTCTIKNGVITTIK